MKAEEITQYAKALDEARNIVKSHMKRHAGGEVVLNTYGVPRSLASVTLKDGTLLKTPKSVSDASKLIESFSRVAEQLPSFGLEVETAIRTHREAVAAADKAAAAPKLVKKAA